jgi:N-acetylornithine carbamoyltransferase
VRLFADGKSLEADLDETAFRAIARVVEKPLINLESAMNHPCQALADWKTLDDLELPRNGKFVLSWVYHPRPLPLAVPAAALHMAAMRGMQTVVLRPEGFALPDRVMAKAREAAARSGGSVRETSERREAMEGAHVVYAKEWGSAAHYGNPGAESQARATLTDWCVREEWFKAARQECRLMHCLPVRRNCAVADEVLDGPRSVVQREARNRLNVQMAVLHHLLSGV